jgi:glycosyltransferase involved in cell wall biosynthesis
MKVAMICAYPLSGPYSGMPYLKGLAHHLSQVEDIDLHIITFGDENKQFKEGKLTLHVLKRRLRAFLMIPVETWQLRREILQINPDIVHVQSTGFPYCTAATLLHKEYPTVLTVHGIFAEFAKFARGIEFIFLRLVAIPLERIAISKVPNIIVVSFYQKDLIRTMTNSEIHVIPPGIDFESAGNLRSTKPVKHPSLFFIGGLLSKRKGADILLTATKIIKRKIPNIYLYVAGSGASETQLKKLAKELEIEENVEFLGPICDEEKWAYYKTADICVIPSLWEGMPTVLLEAMMCGKPVVASNVDGIPEVLIDHETGLLFEPGNTEDLAEQIIMLVRNQETRERMGEAGRRRVRDFTFDKIAEQTVKLYQAILGTPLQNLNL